MDGDWTVPGYRHVRPLGEGASGKVMLAVHEATNAPVAIKYLSGRLRTDEDFLRRFRTEARLMSRLDDPHIVRFYEYVETPGSAALVMELVEGVTLKDVIGAEGATGPEAALLVLKGSLLGLAAAHAAGVVHRDYKPANVLIDDQGHSKLADFGVAVRAGDEVGAAGTPAYMAPEQWATGAVSAATDVYAATAVCYECLTGERPFPVKGHWALAAAHRSDPVPVERVPRPLRELVAYGMAKNSDDRPRSAAVFLEELEEIALSAYGPGWEERGRVRLAALAALLASLFPLAGSPPEAGTALALTRLGR
ncbi:serine/threonine-protein kinase, partial [Actinoallomurus acaciae]